MNANFPDVYRGARNLKRERTQPLYDKLINHSHRELEGAAPGDPLPFSYSEFEPLVTAALAGGRCYHCGRPLNKWTCSADHKQPLSAGGTSELSNIRIICKHCKEKKGDMPDDQFHGKMFPTRLANGTGDVDKAARGSASGRLNAAKMRDCLKFWSTRTRCFPMVHAICRIIQRAFDTELTERQALHQMAEVTGELAAVMLRREKATQVSPQYDRSAAAAQESSRR